MLIAWRLTRIYVGKVLGCDIGAKLGSTDGKVLGTILGNVYGITHNRNVGTEMVSLD